MRYAAGTTAAPRISVNVLVALYLFVGAIVAATHRYWAHLHTLKGWGSALLGTVLWPLILVGINLHVH